MSMYGVWLSGAEPECWLVIPAGIFATPSLGHAKAEAAHYLRDPHAAYHVATAALFDRDGRPFIPRDDEPPPSEASR